MFRKKMPGTKLKFAKKTEKIQSRGSKKQGLTGNKVKLAGNKKKKQDGAFKYLKQGKSSYPDSSGRDMFANMARGDISEDSFDSESMSSSASSMMREQVRPRKPRAQHREDFSDLESMSSMSSGRYSGSSMGSAGSIPMEKSFDILREGGGGTNPFGISDEQMEEAEKQDILARLFAMRSRGVKLSKNYTARSSLSELRLEMGRIEHEQHTQKSVQRLRRYLLMGVSGVQYASNTKYSPRFAQGKLNGFSDYVLSSIDDYDGIFEQMSERYGSLIGVGQSGNPLVDLLMLTLSQVAMFLFMQHKAGVKPPSADDIKKNHPDLIRNMASQMAKDMREEEKAQESRIRTEELQRMQQYQRQTRQTYVPPQYTAPPQRSYVTPTPQQSHMPEPSFQIPLEQIITTETVDTSAPDMYDVLRTDPDQQETIEELHEQTVPTEEWVPSELNNDAISAPLDIAAPEQRDVLPLYEQPETFPSPPSERAKMVEMPLKGISTRKGKQVKVNLIQPEEKRADEDKKTIQIN